MGLIDGTFNEPTNTYRPRRLFQTEKRVLEHLIKLKRADEIVRATRDEIVRATRDELYRVSGSKGKTTLGFLYRLMLADYVLESFGGFYITGLGEHRLYEDILKFD